MSNFIGFSTEQMFIVCNLSLSFLSWGFHSWLNNVSMWVGAQVGHRQLLLHFCWKKAGGTSVTSVPAMLRCVPYVGFQLTSESFAQSRWVNSAFRPGRFFGGAFWLLGPHLLVLRGYSLFFTQNLLLAGLEDPMRCRGLNPSWLCARHLTVLSAVLFLLLQGLDTFLGAPTGRAELSLVPQDRNL